MNESLVAVNVCQPVTPTVYPSSCMGHARGVAAPLFALYSAESNPRPFERTGQPTPPTAQAVDVRHVGNGAPRSIQSTHHCTDTSYEDTSMTTKQTPSWRCAYHRLQQCAVCRMRAMEEHKAPTSAGEWAPVEFGGNLRARPFWNSGSAGSRASV